MLFCCMLIGLNANELMGLGEIVLLPPEAIFDHSFQSITF